ncbi:unnamed protein product [Cuscuta campestris]|uniref:Phytocyanin domain-containing protein n=1 Tax=Cuscuta campestris TaxID=132261 RepID=A0A484KPN7_9ASTE|nr:unnamed protein product [Cuscuta campestris]
MAAQNSSRNVLHVLGCISACILLLFVHKGSALELNVGGDGVWNVPSDKDSNRYNRWAEKHRFQINDTIVFKFQDKNDSVLLVSKEDYNKCDTSKPIEQYGSNGGGQQMTVTLGHSGPFYFISGLHCDKNEKLVVVVLADRRHNNPAAPPPQSKNPTTPSPAPAGEGSPPPPPSGPSPSGVVTPTPAPSIDSPPSKNGGFQMVSGFVSSIGVTLVGSLLLLF